MTAKSFSNKTVDGIQNVSSLDLNIRVEDVYDQRKLDLFGKNKLERLGMKVILQSNHPITISLKLGRNYR